MARTKQNSISHKYKYVYCMYIYIFKLYNIVQIEAEGVPSYDNFPLLVIFVGNPTGSFMDFGLPASVRESNMSKRFWKFPMLFATCQGSWDTMGISWGYSWDRILYI